MKRLLMVTILISGWFVSLYPVVHPQGDCTNTYFEDLTHLLSLEVFTLLKSNVLELSYPAEGRIDLRPNGHTNLGVGVNYRSAGIAVSFGLPHSQASVSQ